MARVDTRGAVASRPALLRALQTRAGEPYDPARIQAELRALWALRLFDEVSVEAEAQPSGVALTYVVVERPLVERISFPPLKAAPEAEIAELVAALRGAPADPLSIDDATSRVRARLRELGHRLARVETEQGRAGAGGVLVRFLIDEGPRVVVDRWSFTGNAKVKEAVLRAQMQSGAYNVAGGLYDEERWARDASVISYDYFDHGMLTAHVGEAEVTASADGAALSVVVPIVEGPVFHHGKVEIADPSPAKSAGKGAPALRLKRGEIFNRSRVKDELVRLKAWFAREQHRTVEISPYTDLDVKAGQVDLVLRVEDARPSASRE